MVQRAHSEHDECAQSVDDDDHTFGRGIAAEEERDAGAHHDEEHGLVKMSS